MTSEISHDAEVRDEAIYSPNSSSADESGLEIPCSGSANGHSTDEEDGGLDGSQPSLKGLLLKIAADEDSTLELSLRDLLVKLKLEDSFQQADCDAALHVAARHGLVDEARELIDAGANVSMIDKKQRQPLHRACSKGHTELAELLLHRKAEIEPEKLKLLLSKEPKTQVTDENGWSTLHWASRNGHDEVVRRLLAADISNIDAPEENESWTALHIATYYGHVGVITTLLENGASLKSRDNDRWTPLMTATRKENSDVMRQLLESPESKDSGHLETRDDLGRTPLLSASTSGFSDGARQLIAAGANLNAQSETSKSTPLIAATSWRYSEIVNYLLAAGASVNIQDVDDQTALHEASRENHIEIVQSLLKQSGINIEVGDKYGQTALHMASKRGNGSVVKLLLEKDATMVDATDNEGRTALHLASGALGEDDSQLDSDEYGPDGLIDKERDNSEFQSGRYYDVVRLLLEKKANPGKKTGNDDTAFHFAANLGDIGRLDLILKKKDKCDLLTRNKKGHTALYSAFKGAQPESAMRSIMELGKPKTAEFGLSEVGDEALDWAARDSKTHDIAKWLLQKRPENFKENPFPKSDEWIWLQWAVYRQLPGILFRLIATSDRSSEIEVALESALDVVKEIKKGLQSSNTTKKLGELSRTNPSTSRQGKNKTQERGETDHDVQPSEPRQKVQKSAQSKDLDTIEDILRDPPFFIQMRTKRKGYALPQPIGTTDVVDAQANFEATVVQFYEEGAVSTIRRNRPVNQVIYETGPTKIMEAASKFLDSVISKSAGFSSQAKYSGTKPKFTWVHLPSTNIDWMNDLLTRIMKEEKRSTRQYHEVRSFFRDSWVEIPDRTSLSRFMRPRTVMRQQTTSRSTDVEGEGTNKTDGITHREELESSDEEEEKRRHDETEEAQEDESLTDGAEEEENKVKAEKGRPKKKAAGFIAASAVYMPYFCFSTLCGEQPTPGEKQPKPSEKQKKFKKAQANYDKLLEVYSNRTIHGSPTLDEWFYHFGPDSTGDRNHRNETQVVTKFLKAHKIDNARADKSNPHQVDKSDPPHGDKSEAPQINKSDPPQADKSDPPHGDKSDPPQVDKSDPPQVEKINHSAELSRWTLLRVNQLWVWTLDDKWIITATSCLLDDSRDTLVDGVLEQLGKQAEWGESGSQPDSVADMNRLIVDYCISSYERRRKSDSRTVGTQKPGGQPDYDEMSLGQIFSNYMNQIGRDEAALFEDFSSRTHDSRQQAQRNENAIGPKGSSPAEGTPKAQPGASPDILPKTRPGTSSVDEIKNKIKNAEELYCDIKDVRDELNILKAVVQHQKFVQKLLASGHARDGNPSTTYLKQMKDSDLSAAHILSYIEEMDIVADRIQSAVNTTLSLQQNDIAIGQGRILMAFTFATLLFLPLSFLSSLFALDVSSFLTTPTWAFIVIFLVSVATSVVVALIAIDWSTMVLWATKLVPRPIKRLVKFMLSFFEGMRVRKSEKDGTSGGDSAPPSPQPVPTPGTDKADYRRMRPTYTFRSRGTRVEDTPPV